MGGRVLLLAAAFILSLGIACAELPVDINAPVVPPCAGKASDLSPRNDSNLYWPGPSLSPGWYEIWCGRRTGRMSGQPDIWRAYGPVELHGGTFYILDVVAKELSAENPRKINFTIGTPHQKEARVWYRLSNESPYVVCFDGPYESEVMALHEPSAAKSSLEEELLFEITSDAAVNDGPVNPTTFFLKKPSIITRVETLHWNHGKGQKPGTIGLSGEGGMMYGPWQAYGTPGTGGVPNVYWKAVTSGLELPSGTYVVVDSDPATWSYNRETKGRGIVWVYGQTVEASRY